MTNQIIFKMEEPHVPIAFFPGMEARHGNIVCYNPGERYFEVSLNYYQQCRNPDIEEIESVESLFNELKNSAMRFW